ncbi:MAG: hypothetical protein QGI18_05415 [Candidatus Marinimicrobia bacterium]|jgi:hypothetical protein|nr:hypothetical protein [Candidatus Neomarinimicrobiota bacterium]
MNLNNEIINFKEPNLKKQVDIINSERKMFTISFFLFLEKVFKIFNFSK